MQNFVKSFSYVKENASNFRPKKTLASENVGHEKNLHPGGRNYFLINLTEFFRLNVYPKPCKIQSLTWTYHCRSQNLQPAGFFSFFLFVCVCVRVFFFFLNQKIYILIQFQLCGQEISPGDFRKQEYFFWPENRCWMTEW